MIERIYVHNYRCFENFTLDLKGKPSALVIGKNGSGKSTLRHVLGVLQEACQVGALSKETISDSDFFRLDLEVPMRFEVTVVLKGKTYDYSLALEWSGAFQRPVLQEEDLLVDGRTIFSRRHDEVVLGDSAPARLAFPGTLVSFHGGADAEHPAKQFRNFFRSAVIVSPVPLLMTGHVDGEFSTMATEAAELASWLSSVVSKQPARYGDLLKYIQNILPDVAAFEFEPIGRHTKQFRVQFGDSGTPPKSLWLDFDQLSDGEKCFFLSAAVVAFNRKENPLFCFWDEPDNHLAPHEVGHFVMALRKMVHNGGQFIATSHHPEAIRRFSDENTFVFTRNSHLEPTRVRTLSDLEHKGDLINAILLGEVLE